jgi:hypothetical protein
VVKETPHKPYAGKPQGAKPTGKSHRKGAVAAGPDAGVSKYKPGKAKGWAAKKPGVGKPKPNKGGSAVPRRPKPSGAPT